MNDRDNKVSNHTWEVVDVNYVVPIFVSKFSNHINIEQSQPLQVFLPRQVRNQMKLLKDKSDRLPAKNRHLFVTESAGILSVNQDAP